MNALPHRSLLSMKQVHSVCIGLVVLAASCAQADSFTNHTYQLVATNLTWHEAKVDAESRGGHLATITSSDEWEYILSLQLPFHPQDAYWLGATDEGHEGIWTWVTGELWGFAMWSPGEPNNLNIENYLASEADANHRWNDWGKSTDTNPYYLLEIENTHCTPSKAKATAQLVNGFIVGATVTDSGCGYTNPPVVIVQGGGGSGAIARATVTDGQVTRVQIVDAGCCYTNAPRIVISSPPSLPTVEIVVSKVKVVQNVVLGWKYTLESSSNAVNWTATGPAFVADTDPIETEFVSEGINRFYRLQVVR